MQVDITLSKAEVARLRKEVIYRLTLTMEDDYNAVYDKKQLYKIIPKQKIEAEADKLVQVAIDEIAKELKSEGGMFVDNPFDLPCSHHNCFEDRLDRAAARLVTRKAAHAFEDLVNDENLTKLRRAAEAQGYELTPLD